MRLTELPLSDLVVDPSNVRQTYRRIPELAESIAEVGLLENLVVREADDCFVVVAGSRRLKALQLLASEGRWSAQVPSLVVNGPGTIENLVENACRDEVPVWQLGRRYNELYEAGYQKQQIASRVGRGPGHVSIAMQIASGLAPPIVQHLERLGPDLLNVNQILRIAKLYDPETMEPDEDAQRKELSRQLGMRRDGRKRNPRSTIAERERVWMRYQKLKRGVSVPGHAMPYVNAFLRYLDGSDQRLKFR